MRNKYIAVTVLLLPALAVGVVYQWLRTDSAPEGYIHRVVSVVDGDTIVVSPGKDGERHIRYLGIDTPERFEPYSDKARKMNRSLVYNKSVRIETAFRRDDVYYRVLGFIFVHAESGQEVMVNLRLVEEGLAWLYPTDMQNTPYYDKFLSAQSNAIAKRINLWSSVNLDSRAYLETEGSFFHFTKTCRKRTRLLETTVEQAFLSAKIPCRRCRSGRMWRK